MHRRTRCPEQAAQLRHHPRRGRARKTADEKRLAAALDRANDLLGHLDNAVSRRTWRLQASLVARAEQYGCVRLVLRPQQSIRVRIEFKSSPDTNEPLGHSAHHVHTGTADPEHGNGRRIRGRSQLILGEASSWRATLMCFSSFPNALRDVVPRNIAEIMKRLVAKLRLQRHDGMRKVVPASW